MKKILIISIVVLTILIVLTFFLNNLFKKKPVSNNPLVIPTSIFNKDYQDLLERGSTTNPKSKLAITPIKHDELALLTLSKSKLPITDSDYEIKYSEILDKFVVYPKNDKGIDKINRWFKDNKIEDIVLKNNLYVISDKPVDEYIKEAEANIAKNNEIARNQTGDNTGGNNGNDSVNKRNNEEGSNNNDTNPTGTKTISPTNSQTQTTNTTTGDHEYNQIDALADLLKLIEGIDLNVGTPAEPTGVPSTTSPTNAPGGPYPPPKTIDGLVYYSQCEEPYASYSLGSCKMCYAGCGPTTLAMIVSSYSETGFNPIKAVEYIKSSGDTVDCDIGTKWSTMTTTLKNKGISVTNSAIFYEKDGVSGSQISNELRNYIKAGWTILTGANFVYGGHFFWIVDVDEAGNIWAYDPYYAKGQVPYNENLQSPKYKLAFGVKKQ